MGAVLSHLYSINEVCSMFPVCFWHEFQYYFQWLKHNQNIMRSGNYPFNLINGIRLWRMSKTSQWSIITEWCPVVPKKHHLPCVLLRLSCFGIDQYMTEYHSLTQTGIQILNKIKLVHKFRSTTWMEAPINLRSRSQKFQIELCWPYCVLTVRGRRCLRVLGI